MTLAIWIASAFGVYDPEVAAQLDVAHRRRVQLVGLSCLGPCGVAAVSVGYAASLIVGVSPGGLLTIIPSVVIATFVMGSLLRIILAGSGIALQLRPEDAARWKPKRLPAVYLGLMGIIFAQPLVAFLLAPILDSEIAQVRDRIATAHEVELHAAYEQREAELLAHVAEVQRRLYRATARLEREQEALSAKIHTPEVAGTDAVSEGVREVAAEVARLEGELAETVAALNRAGIAATVNSEEMAAYRRALESGSFLAERIRLAWAHTLFAGATTMLTGFLTGLPLLVRQQYLGQYAYEQHRVQRMVVASHAALADRLADAEYRKMVRGVDGKPRRACPNYSGPARPRFADPPFNTEPLDFFAARLGAPLPSVAADDGAISRFLASLPE